MHGLISFIVATVLILGTIVAFAVILIGSWIVGTVYLWIDGAGNDRPELNEGNRSIRR